jgi:hypothetical protein
VGGPRAGADVIACWDPAETNKIDQGSSWKTAGQPTTKIRMIRFAFLVCLGVCACVRVLIIGGF